MSKLGWPEEVFYRRLHSVVDDFGRYYADPGLLRAACYPRQLNKVSDPDIGKWLRACVDAALVRVYPAEDGERYLEVVDFDQQIRAKKSRFPQMLSTCAADAKQEIEDAHLDVSVFGVEDVLKSSSAPPLASSSEDIELSRFDAFWEAYPRKVGKDAARKAFDKRKPNDELTERMIQAVSAQRSSEQWRKDGGQFIPHPSTWLNEGRWQDSEAVEIARVDEGRRAETTTAYLADLGEHATKAQSPEAHAARREAMAKLGRLNLTKGGVQ